MVSLRDAEDREGYEEWRIAGKGDPAAYNYLLDGV